VVRKELSTRRGEKNRETRTRGEMVQKGEQTTEGSNFSNCEAIVWEKRDGPVGALRNSG